MTASPEPYDLFIIGGGINGAGIARDAVGRGYSVALAEMNDFASATSSSSTKLFHGGFAILNFLNSVWYAKRLSSGKFCSRLCRIFLGPCALSFQCTQTCALKSATPTSRHTCDYALDERAAAHSMAHTLGPLPLRPHGRTQILPPPPH